MLRGEIIEAAARMRVDDDERRVLLLQVLEDRDKRHMLDDIGEIAGMEGMAIVHGVCVNPQGSIVHMNNTEKHDPASCAIADLNADLEAKRVSSAELVAFYLDRITRID